MAIRRRGEGWEGADDMLANIAEQEFLKGGELFMMLTSDKLAS